MRESDGRRTAVTLTVLALVTLVAPAVCLADEVLHWNQIACRAITTSTPTVLAPPGPLGLRVVAMTHAAIFDAHNGIERRYAMIHVAPTDTMPERGASRRAAVIQAAFAVLSAAFPAQADALTADRTASLTAIAEDGVDDSMSIARGLAWGQYVADQIRAWRAADNVFPLVNSYGSTEIGQWRPTPPGFLPGFGITLGQAVPFIIPTTSTFRQAGPPALLSLQYATDVNEVQRVGAAGSAARTPDQTQAARFWAATAVTFWNRAAVAAAEQAGTSLSENARLFALLNMAMIDTIFTTWESKYYYNFWRPITAIQLADYDGNDLTIADLNWTPLLTTPNYPEYTSGHQSITGAAATILTAYFGSTMAVIGWSEAFGPSVTRSWASFEAAADEASDARIWAGIHFRTAMLDTRECARQIAAYVLQNAAQPLKGHHTGQLGK
jgi:hypothetical protein